MQYLRIVIVFLITSVSTSAFAWTWTCEPEVNTVTATAPPAKINIMIDHTSSMASGTAPTNWDIAKSAIDFMTSSSDASAPELAHFGLGLFDSTVASNAVDCMTTNSALITSTLNASTPTTSETQTPTDLAINTAVGSACLANAATEKTATVLISDNSPYTDDGANFLGNAIVEACAHRDVAPLHVIGLGTAADVDYNDVLAAAGGTGSCTVGDPCDNPLSYWVYQGTCSGSFNPTTESDLIIDLASISAKLKCTYELDTSVSEDVTNAYETMRVVAKTSSSEYEAYNLDGPRAEDRNSDGINDGWNFVDENRDSILLSPYFCAQVQTGTIIEVSTQLACECSKTLGDSCTGTCGMGTWACNEGVDVCVTPTTDCCTEGASCSSIGAEVGICSVGTLQCPVNSFRDGAFDPSRITYNIDSADQNDPTVSHILRSITVEGIEHSEIIPPSFYQSSFPPGTEMYITENNVLEPNTIEPGSWARRALPAFLSRNLGYYQDNYDIINDGSDYYQLEFRHNPIEVTDGIFLAFADRNMNDRVLILTLDSGYNSLGFKEIVPTDYIGTSHLTNYNEEIGMAVFPMDDFAPTGSKVAFISVYPLAYGSGDAADGKLLVFGPAQSPAGSDPGRCIAALPTAEVCDGLDNNCDGDVDDGCCAETLNGPCEVPDFAVRGVCANGTWQCDINVDRCEPNPTETCCVDGEVCSITGGVGACAEGVKQCTGGLETCIAVTPEPEICDGIDNNCDGVTDEGCSGGVCHPKKVNDFATNLPPNVSLMLDRSASMGPEPTFGGGLYDNECEVCEVAGRSFPVNVASDCPTSASPWTAPPETEVAASYSGTPSFAFTIPVPSAAAAQPIAVMVELRGNYENPSEYAEVYIEGVSYGEINQTYPNCSTGTKQTFIVPASTIVGDLDINILASPDVQTSCAVGENNATVTVGTLNYIARQTNDTVCGITKWDIATGAIDDLTASSDAALREMAHFGLGLFTNGQANMLVDCATQNNAPITAVLDPLTPHSNTPTHAAIYQSRIGDCFTSASAQQAATILITDGFPDEKTRAVEEACRHREDAPLYLLGLGAGTDERFNNVLAAAGGTGNCDGNVDPCDDPSDWASYLDICFGSIQSPERQSDLTFAIASITEALECNFDIGFYAGLESVPIDPTFAYENLIVDYLDASGTVHRIYHLDSGLATDIGGDASVDGWTFTSVERNAVAFSPYLCGEIQSGRIIEVSTHLQCPCTETVGDACNITNPPAGVCGRGTWQCDVSSGLDWCDPDPIATCCVPGVACSVSGGIGACAEGVTTCSGGVETCQANLPQAETCDGIDEDCNGTVDDIAPTDCDVPDLVGRCKAGQVRCVDTGGGVIGSICEQTRFPMPELCNGQDDDCNGQDDDISRSWQQAEPSQKTEIANDDEDLAKACAFQDICICENGAKDNHGGNDFMSYVDEWDPECFCSALLTEENSTQTRVIEDELSQDSEITSCSATGNKFGNLPLLLFLGFFLLIRRRK